MTPQPIYRVTVAHVAPECSTRNFVKTSISLPMPPVGLADFLGAVPVLRYPTSEKPPEAVFAPSYEAARPKAKGLAARHAEVLRYIAANPGCIRIEAAPALGLSESQFYEIARALRVRGLINVKRVPVSCNGGLRALYSVTEKGAKEAME